MKYDGFRALAYLESGSVRLITRNRNAFKSFPDLCATMAACEAESAVLDGEIVFLGKDGRAGILQPDAAAHASALLETFPAPATDGLVEG